MADKSIQATLEEYFHHKKLQNGGRKRLSRRLLSGATASPYSQQAAENPFVISFRP
jgi:hypothetical protein